MGSFKSEHMPTRVTCLPGVHCPPLVNNDDKVDNLEENMLVIVIDLARFAPHPDYNEQLLCDDDDHPLMLISHKLFTGNSHYCAKKISQLFFRKKLLILRPRKTKNPKKSSI